MKYVIISTLLITIVCVFRKSLKKFFVGGQNPPNDDEDNDA